MGMSLLGARCGMLWFQETRLGVGLMSGGLVMVGFDFQLD
jgi:hypothetical protein